MAAVSYSQVTSQLLPAPGSAMGVPGLGNSHSLGIFPAEVGVWDIPGAAPSGLGTGVPLVPPSLKNPIKILQNSLSQAAAGTGWGSPAALCGLGIIPILFLQEKGIN